MTNAQAHTLNQIIKHYVKRYPNILVLGHNQCSSSAKSCPRFFVPAYARALGIKESQIYTKQKFMREGEGYAQVGNIVRGNVA